MNALRSSVQAALVGATLLTVAPAFAGGKTEDPARVVVGGLPTIKPSASLGPGSYLIDFENLSVGATVTSQYAAWGVEFFANAYSGSGGPTGDWATNTDMTVVAVGGGDTGGLGTPSLVSGNLLHSFSGWLGEDGDASFLMAFSAPIKAISIDFAGIANPGSTGIDIFTTAGTYVTTVFATAGGQQTLSYTGADIGYVGVTPGDYDDWVGVDNIGFTVAAAVPEPESYGLLALGLGVVGIAVRRRQQH